MVFARSSYGPGSSTTEAGGLSDPLDTTAYLKALLQAEAARRAGPAISGGGSNMRVALGGGHPASTGAPTTGGLSSGERERGTPLEQQAHNAQLRDIIMTQNAKARGPIRKWTYPYGSAGFLATDPEAENAYGRVYTPLLANLAFEQQSGSGSGGERSGTSSAQPAQTTAVQPEVTFGADWYGLGKVRA